MQAQWEHQLLNLAGNVPHPSDKPFSFYRREDTRLRTAYKKADEVTAKHSKSFYFASQLLPEEKRSAVRTLYAFCRIVDDIVDSNPAKHPEIELNYWRKIVYNGSFTDDDLVAAAWIDTLNRYHIPRHYALQLIDGVARDLAQNRYRSFDELATYCYGVASTVGLMSMFIIGFKSKEAVPYAIKLGVALQMTNILRDVAEDYQNGRIYLPQEELEDFGIRENDLANGKVTPQWRRMMQFQIHRTRCLYDDAQKGIKLLNKDGQLAISAATDFYKGILEAIEARDYDIFSYRASLSKWNKLSRVPGIWLRLAA